MFTGRNRAERRTRSNYSVEICRWQTLHRRNPLINSFKDLSPLKISSNVYIESLLWNVYRTTFQRVYSRCRRLNCSLFKRRSLVYTIIFLLRKVEVFNCNSSNPKTRILSRQTNSPWKDRGGFVLIGSIIRSKIQLFDLLLDYMTTIQSRTNRGKKPIRYLIKKSHSLTDWHKLWGTSRCLPPSNLILA